MPDTDFIIFDLDGTLFQTESVTVPAVRQAFLEQGQDPPSPPEIKRYIGATVKDYHGWLRSRCDPGVADRLVMLADRYELDLIPQSGALYPGVSEVLAALDQQGYGIALCSNGYAGYVKTVLDTQGIGGFFKTVRVPRDSQDQKVAMIGELLQSSCRGWAVVVGDRLDDIEGAHRNGLPAIASAYGFGSAEEHETADAVAHAPVEIPDLVLRLRHAEME